ncbi:MAG: type 4a pilus biogenesis protein PilO [Patescibacteria group bacterium]|jgi:Tfp pilus assembly protein PilO
MNPKDKISMNLDVSKLRGALVNFIIPLICIGASIFVGLLFLMPSLKDKPVLIAQLTKNQNLNKQLQDKKATLNDLIDFRSVVEENAQLMDTVLVSEATVPELLAQISMIAQESGFEITRLTYSYAGKPATSSAVSSSTAPVPAATYENVTVSLGVRGSYDQLTTFLGSIENAGRLVDVENYRYSRDKEGILDVNFTLNSPYLFVQSSAVTDESITLDMTSPDFVALLNKVKALRIYKVTPEDISELVVEETTEEEGGETAETPAETPNEGGTPFDFNALP